MVDVVDVAVGDTAAGARTVGATAGVGAPGAVADAANVVREQAKLFECVERHRLRFLDQEYHLFALGMFVDQVALQDTESFVRAATFGGKAKLAGDRGHCQHVAT